MNLKVLNFESNPNAGKVATLIREKRLELRRKDKAKYTQKAVARAIGCSPSHYQSLENGSKELTNVKWLYEIAKTLEIPLDKLVGIYFELPFEELKKNFTILIGDTYSNHNGSLVKERRISIGKELNNKVFQKEISEIIGCSSSHFSAFEREERLAKDIRLLYGMAMLLDIPLWVLIRNEIGLKDEEIQKVLSFLPKISMRHMREEVILKIQNLSDGDLKTVAEFLNNLGNTVE